jgi:hypothetical protein
MTGGRRTSLGATSVALPPLEPPLEEAFGLGGPLPAWPPKGGYEAPS